MLYFYVSLNYNKDQTKSEIGSCTNCLIVVIFTFTHLEKSECNVLNFLKIKSAKEIVPNMTWGMSA